MSEDSSKEHFYQVLKIQSAEASKRQSVRISLVKVEEPLQRVISDRAPSYGKNRCDEGAYLRTGNNKGLSVEVASGVIDLTALFHIQFF
jgi:hypothetical protein